MSKSRNTQLPSLPSVAGNGQEPCPCKDGMNPDSVDPARRKLLFSAVAATTAGALAMSKTAEASKKAVVPGAVDDEVAEDPTKGHGRPR